ncbi:MAG: bifunctional nuclease family protein [Vampirovibrionales bacterium]|nr:bifunctional nuclease family protein [Vampirovibrionales bacterium]
MLTELRVMGIALDTRTGTPIVVLNDADNRRALPIWIGTAEASAIIRILENIKSARPMTHDLMQVMLDKLGYVLKHVEINDMSADTYFATLCLARVGSSSRPIAEDFNETSVREPSAEVSDLASKGKLPPDEIFIDARPSDAIALALRSDAPIFATANVMAEGTISTDLERDEQEQEAFRDFLKNVKASDFGDFKFDREIESDQ